MDNIIEFGKLTIAKILHFLLIVLIMLFPIWLGLVCWMQLISVFEAVIEQDLSELALSCVLLAVNYVLLRFNFENMRKEITIFYHT